MSDRLAEIIHFVIKYYRQPFHMDEYLRLLQKSDPRLVQLFSELYGVSPREWVWIFRTAMAAELLQVQPDFSATEIAEFVGFENETFFETCFVRLIGKTPQVFQARSHVLRSAEHGASAQARSLACAATDLVDKVLEKVAPPHYVTNLANATASPMSHPVF